MLRTIKNVVVYVAILIMARHTYISFITKVVVKILISHVPNYCSRPSAFGPA